MSKAIIWCLLATVAMATTAYCAANSRPERTYRGYSRSSDSNSHLAQDPNGSQSFASSHSLVSDYNQQRMNRLRPRTLSRPHDEARRRRAPRTSQQEYHETPVTEASAYSYARSHYTPSLRKLQRYDDDKEDELDEVDELDGLDEDHYPVLAATASARLKSAPGSATEASAKATRRIAPARRAAAEKAAAAAKKVAAEKAAAAAKKAAAKRAAAKREAAERVAAEKAAAKKARDAAAQKMEAARAAARKKAEDAKKEAEETKKRAELVVKSFMEDDEDDDDDDDDEDSEDSEDSEDDDESDDEEEDEHRNYEQSFASSSQTSIEKEDLENSKEGDYRFQADSFNKDDDEDEYLNYDDHDEELYKDSDVTHSKKKAVSFTTNYSKSTRESGNSEAENDSYSNFNKKSSRKLKKDVDQTSKKFANGKKEMERSQTKAIMNRVDELKSGKPKRRDSRTIK